MNTRLLPAFVCFVPAWFHFFCIALAPDSGFETSIMNDHIYKKIELIGSSPTGIEDAVNNAVNRAAKTVRNMRWFEVSEIRGHIADNKIDHWQVSVKIGFTLDA